MSAETFDSTPLTSQLPEAIQVEIKVNAHRNFNPMQGYNGYNEAANKGYEKGATDYALKYQSEVEILKKANEGLVEALELAECEIKAMYKRMGITGSNVQDIIETALKQYNETL